MIQKVILSSLKQNVFRINCNLSSAVSAARPQGSILTLVNTINYQTLIIMIDGQILVIIINYLSLAIMINFETLIIMVNYQTFIIMINYNGADSETRENVEGRNTKIESSDRYI